ncbi:DUF3617 family protein [Sphingomonas sp. R86521]|uniref:DUF3617 domain-containing protein n=1 Tax=Sphingomonas sp. R86521 TaxID=3093860 RepID=UPI0036D2A6BB
MKIRATLASGLIAAASVAVAQDVPVARNDPPPEIVVTGQVPQVQDGLWRIRRWPMRSVSYPAQGPSAGQTVSLTPGGETRLCVANDKANQAIVALLDNDDRSLGCSRLRLRLEHGRLRGSMTCMRLTDLGPLEMTAHYRGTMTPQRIDVRVATRMTLDGEDFGESTMRLEADRTGDCAPVAASSAVRQAAPLPAPTSKTNPALDPAVAEPALAEDATRADAAVTPAQPRAATTGATGSADDVVVVARRLRKLRLNYASSHRVMSRCRADISSGDKRVDRIGCAIVRACVRAGFEEPGPALACFRRKVNSLDPDDPPSG